MEYGTTAYKRSYVQYHLDIIVEYLYTIKNAKERFEEHMETKRYKPLIFILLVFAITWACVFIMSIINYEKWILVFNALDFIESASPLIVSLILLRNYISRKHFLVHFFFGKYYKWYRYIFVLIIFIVQYLNFYLFRINDGKIMFLTFIKTFMGQIVFGGGLEEAGWRGYLQPAIERKTPLFLAVIVVGIIWAVWHLPYFILPGNIHTDGNFIIYAFIGIITSFILTAIYKLTGSIMLCTLFHGWQNTIVMIIPAKMDNLGFIIMFTVLGITSLIICIMQSKIDNRIKI
jgi:membrane protease YdiL (CAAX protease family)